MQVDMGAAAERGGQSVVGVFDSDEATNEVIERLAAEGLPSENLSVMKRDARATVETAVMSAGNPVFGGAAALAVLGGLLGALAGWMIAIGAIGVPGVANGVPSIPGVGTVLGEGVLAATITGLLFGAALGALIGALLGLRVPKQESVEQEGPLHEGRVLVTVHPAGMVDTGRAEGIMQNGGAYDIRVYGSPLELDAPDTRAEAEAEMEAPQHTNPSAPTNEPVTEEPVDALSIEAEEGLEDDQARTD